MHRFHVWLAMTFAGLLLLLSAGASAQTPHKPFEPTSGQAGKDVVWVPTPPVLVEKMLPVGRLFPRTAGVVLVAAGTWLIAT